jgi:hypothetical protein
LPGFPYRSRTKGQILADAGQYSPFAWTARRAKIDPVVDRKVETQPETREELVQHLERLTGRTFRTREDIQAYVREVSTRDDPSLKRWIKVKHIALAGLLAYGVIQYYVLDVMLEIVSIQSPTFFIPVRGALKSLFITLGSVLA